MRTNLRMDELDFINSKRLPRPCRSLRLEEIRLLSLASLSDSLLQREAPGSICWSVSALRGTYGPRQRVWRTASSLTSALLSCSDQARALATHCSPGFPLSLRGNAVRRTHQLNAHSTASCSNNWAELGCLWR